MPKNAQNTDKQLSIFRLLTESSPKKLTEGSFRCIDEVRVALRYAIKGCDLSRHQIAGEMSHLVGENISKEMIDSWTRESDIMNGRAVRHVPAEYLPAFCRVTGDYMPLSILARRCGLFVMEGIDALRADIQRLDEKIEKTRGVKREQEKMLREMVAHFAGER